MKISQVDDKLKRKATAEKKIKLQPLSVNIQIIVSKRFGPALTFASTKVRTDKSKKSLLIYADQDCNINKQEIDSIDDLKKRYVKKTGNNICKLNLYDSTSNGASEIDVSLFNALFAIDQKDDHFNITNIYVVIGFLSNDMTTSMQLLDKCKTSLNSSVLKMIRVTDDLEGEISIEQSYACYLFNQLTSTNVKLSQFDEYINLPESNCLDELLNLEVPHCNEKIDFITNVKKPLSKLLQNNKSIIIMVNIYYDHTFYTNAQIYFL